MPAIFGYTLLNDVSARDVQFKDAQITLGKKGEGVTFPGLDFTRKEVTILGSRASVDCFPEALRLLASGAIRYTSVATAMPLAEAPEAFARLAKDQGAYHKAVFVLESR